MEWFLLNSGRVEGPFKAQILKEKIEREELDATTFVCRQGDPHWKPLEEVREEIFIAAKPDEEMKNWILLTENMELALSKEQEGQFVQSGPYTTIEILDLLQAGTCKYSDFIWKTGFEKWVRINEVDEFFGSPETAATAEVSVSDTVSDLVPEFEFGAATLSEDDTVSNSVLLEQVLEQTQLNNYDFVDEEKVPLGASPIDQAVFKTMSLPEVTPLEITPPETIPQFVLSAPAIPEIVETPRLEVIDRKAFNIIESATKYFPWLMTGLAAILVVMVGVWALSLGGDTPRESAQLPPATPAKKKGDKALQLAKPAIESKYAMKPAPPAKVEAIAPAIPAEQSKPVVIQQTVSPKVSKIKLPIARPAAHVAAVPVINQEQLNLITWRLLKRAERLESQYETLKDNPIEWKRFYQAWNSELDRATNIPSDRTLEKSMVFRQLKIGRNRLEDRAQMMDKSVMQATPVSSDFRAEDLPGLFRNIQGQIRRQ